MVFGVGCGMMIAKVEAGYFANLTHLRMFFLCRSATSKSIPTMQIQCFGNKAKHPRTATLRSRFGPAPSSATCCRTDDGKLLPGMPSGHVMCSP